MKKTVGYAQAIEEIEQILARFKSDDFDVDTLFEQVKRATELIKMCKDKLHKTEQDVAKIIEQQ